MWSRSLFKAITYSSVIGFTMFAAKENERKHAEFKEKYPHVKASKRSVIIPLVGQVDLNEYPSDQEAQQLETQAINEIETTNQRNFK